MLLRSARSPRTLQKRLKKSKFRSCRSHHQQQQQHQQQRTSAAWCLLLPPSLILHTTLLYSSSIVVCIEDSLILDLCVVLSTAGGGGDCTRKNRKPKKFGMDRLITDNSLDEEGVDEPNGATNNNEDTIINDNTNSMSIRSTFRDEASLGSDDGNTTGNMTQMVPWRQRLLWAQQWSLVLAPITALFCLGVVGVWISELGGLKDATVVFNWHPLFMILAFLFMTVSSLIFRYPSSLFLVVPPISPVSLLSRIQQQVGVLIPTTRSIAKWWHGICWSVAAVCMILGLVAVFHSHNHLPASASGASFIANLYSLHSWVGITVVIFYFGQFLSAVGAFGIPTVWGVSPAVRANLLQLHTFTGPLIYNGVLHSFGIVYIATVIFSWRLCF